ncbi:MAG TPA: BLUF domain-containing protein [Allosphingosinicella sp.]|uniref:BLUF domain-containing protein n=1 Tax=Allosphingosinicella sp. TaxID=2823234 RepID=UPI002EDBACCC
MSPLISLLYVSEANHMLPEGENPVEGIVEVALSRNPKLDVTGALVFTGPHFAQVLEGPKAGVDELLTSIRRDPRHRNMHVVQAVEIAEREFPYWSLAYAGPSLYVDRHLRPLVEWRATGSGEEGMQAQRLIKMMRAFAQEQKRTA